VGGLDVESAQLARPPGLLMGCLNYESVTENGYERLGGMERFDGRPRPSDAEFAILEAATTFSAAVGDTLTGASSGATAKVIAVRTTSQLVVSRQVGSFTLGETLNVSGNPVGVYDGVGTDFDSFDENIYAALAAADYRADIGQVPGSGRIRGIAELNGTLYAWRNNAGGTAMAIYKSTAAGWSAVTLFKEVAFNTGSGTAPAEGATITKGGVTATVKRVVLESGTWAGGTAAGRFIVDNVAGGNFSAGAFTAGVTATCVGAETQITLAANGRVDAVVYNFTGSTATERIYGADGVNRGFEFDGTVYVPIRTGMTTDTPTHCWCHLNHLFFSFLGSAQHSGIGQPYAWSAVLGAAELACGAEIIGFDSLPGDFDTSALLIATTKRILVLYGTSSADWKLTTFDAKTGAQRWSLQNLGAPIVFNGYAIETVRQSQQFGNFERPEVSSRIRRFLASRTATASVVVRSKSRMRIFFEDGEGISITAIPTANGGQRLAFTAISYGKTVYCTCEALINSENRTFFGSDDGYVYEADRGRGFDGATVTAWAKLAFNFAKSPGLKKRFRWSDIEVKPQSACALRVQGEYSLGDIDVSLTPVYTKEMRGQGGLYDVSNYDQCFYDSPTQGKTRIRHDGTGDSLSLTFHSESDDELPHELQSVTNFYTPRRLERG
jgi:hypothetical protein